MRKRNFVIGAVLAVAGSLAMTGVASAAVAGQTYSSVADKTKQDKKVRGPVGLFTTNVDTQYSGDLLPPGSATCNGTTQFSSCKYFPPATQTLLKFDTAFKFDPGNIPDCNPALLTGKDTAGAVAACGASQVGQGTSLIHTLTEAGTPPGNPGVLHGVVSAFNGVPVGNAPVILLHVDIAESTTSPILTGTLNGTNLTVDVPVTPGTVIEHFDTTINQKRIKKANKKKGKPAKYYVSAKCNDGKWTHSEITTFQGGSTGGEKSFEQKCTKKKKNK